MSQPPRCRFCSRPGFLHFLDSGCFCYPDDRWQWLCIQHQIRATPLAGFEWADARPIPILVPAARLWS